MLALFFSSFLAATILPISSEVHLAYLSSSNHSKLTLLVVATAGNTLGGLSCYILGYLGKWNWLEKFFKIKESSVITFKKKLESYKGWPAIMCWLPIIGDPLAVTYGFMRAPFWTFLIYMSIGKLLRYIFVIYLVGLF